MIINFKILKYINRSYLLKSNLSDVNIL